MQTADFNHNDFDNGQQNKLDEQLLVKFFVKQVENKAESLKEGRPIFRDVEYIDIKVPGNRTGGASRPAQFRDKQRFPRHYEAFKSRQEMPTEGTPLAEWPLMSRSQVEELAFYNVKTVEQLVAMTDTNAGQFMGIRALQAKAKTWLDKTDETARINEIESLKTTNDEQAETINSLQSQMTDLMAKFEKLDTKSVVKSAAKSKG